jgi:hypothetical protein
LSRQPVRDTWVEPLERKAPDFEGERPVSTAFVMRVSDVFFMNDKIVLSGKAESKDVKLEGIECSVVVDSVEVGRVLLEGMVTGSGVNDTTDVWTRSAVTLSRDTVVNHDVLIRQI